MVGAVIYVRVSTKEQTENLSLPTQLRACEEYCRRQGYEVLERFHEEGESAKTTDRSQLQALLKYCRTHKGKVHFVVVYNLTRFAREKYDHFALRAYLKSLGITAVETAKAKSLWRKAPTPDASAAASSSRTARIPNPTREGIKSATIPTQRTARARAR